MQIVGYADRLSVTPGATIRVMVSCRAADYRAGVVRLFHGDINPAGPGFKSHPVPSPIDGRYPGRTQHIQSGSYIRVEPSESLAPAQSFTIGAWIWPTTPGQPNDQAILGHGSLDREGSYFLTVNSAGNLTLRIVGAPDEALEFDSGVALQSRRWYFVSASYDCESGEIRIRQVPLPGRSVGIAGGAVRYQGKPSLSCDRSAEPFLIGAALTGDLGVGIGCFYNGKIERPFVFSRVLADDELQSVQERRGSADLPGLAADWDFSNDPGSDLAYDCSSSANHGRVVNMPTRACTGHNWSGDTADFRHAPDEYGAIHFHDDDLSDAKWETDFELTVPQDWKSGVYAIHLQTSGFEDYVPFFVRPAAGSARAQIALLMPTLTYMAYANEHMVAVLGTARDRDAEILERALAGATEYEREAFRYIVDNRQHSLYDFHSDGSGVCYSSRLRPILNFRPRYNKPNLRFQFTHLLNCDLYLVDWLTQKGYDFDVITDEDLHQEGQQLLSPYRTVITGTHPEYWTGAMQTGLEGYLGAGGRLMYMGGNGFYWVTSISDRFPHIVEVRRGNAGSRPWTSEPGEVHHSTTSEIGGLWRHRGRPPQANLGIGFAAQCGLDKASPYRRTEASRQGPAAFIFEGVEEEIIGDFGLHMGGAAGWELDRVDDRLGTPPNTIVVASSFGHSNAYQHAIEESTNMGSDQGGEQNPLVRADLAYFEGPNGGAVFSVGSISWSGCLSHNDYENSISRVTANVLDRFSAEG